MIGDLRRHIPIALFVLALPPANELPAQSSCTSAPLAVQVLGSGGPGAGGTRASTSYLVWRSGRPVVMVDAGGGSFLRFGEAGARLADLSLIAISHIHPDHVADLPAVLWLSENARQRPLSVAGPSGEGMYPGFGEFLTRLFDESKGAFPMLSGTLGQRGRGTRLDVIQVASGAGTTSSVFADSSITVSAHGVPHLDVPSIAYRVQAGNRAIVFGSDQNGTDARFSQFASGADLVVMHFGITEAAPDDLARLHAKPGLVGLRAKEANAKKLVLSHLMQPPPLARAPQWFTLPNPDQALADLKRNFSGPVEIAADLQCFAVD
jgi:ribonuclease BN (tRNA processing enzyme)